MVEDVLLCSNVTNVTSTASIPFMALLTCTMLTEPWIVERVSMALRTHTFSQPVESMSNDRTKRGEARRFTNYLDVPRPSKV